MVHVSNVNVNAEIETLLFDGMFVTQIDQNMLLIGLTNDSSGKSFPCGTRVTSWEMVNALIAVLRQSALVAFGQDHTAN